MSDISLQTPTLFIIILNWNGKEDTLECLGSLAQVSEPFTIIVVDNGSTDDSVTAIENAFPDLILIKSKENVGFAEGNNIGIGKALALGAESVLLLNNDTLVEPRFISHFLNDLKKHPEKALFGAKILLQAEPSRLDHFGGVWNPAKAQFDLIGYRQIERLYPIEQPIDLDYICGCALLVRKEVFEAIGLLEPDFFLIWEEADFCMRAKRAGFGLHISHQARVFHKVSASFIGKPHSAYFWWRNRFLWIKRNCSQSEKQRIYCRIFIKEVYKLLKLRALNSLQTTLFPSKRKQAKRASQHAYYSACLSGVKDYFFNRLGKKIG